MNFVKRRQKDLRCILAGLSNADPFDRATQLDLVIAATTKFDRAIEEEYWHRLRSKAIDEFVRLHGHTGTVENPETCLKTAEDEYLKTEERDFILMTYLSAKHGLLPGRRRRAHPLCKIILEEEAPSPYLNARLSRLKDLRPVENKKPPKTRTACRVFIRARSPEEAYARGSWSLDSIRGVWVYRLAVLARSFRMTAVPTPLNPILRGPVETIHQSDGELAGDGDDVWYFDTYPEPERYSGCSLSDAQLRSLKSFEKFFNGKIANSEMETRNSLRGALARLAQALDETDFDKTFLKLWSLLEWLCNKGDERAKYGLLVDRAASVYEDRDQSYHKSVLEGLRCHRNRLSHASVGLGHIAGSSHGKQENYLRQLLNYLCVLLLLFISNCHRLEGRDSFCEFLDDLNLSKDFRERYSSSRLLKDLLDRSGNRRATRGRQEL